MEASCPHVINCLDCTAEREELLARIKELEAVIDKLCAKIARLEDENRGT